MKRLWLVIMTASVLVAVVTGCGGAGRNDARLVAADSLMQPDPDSALALVLAVPRDSLTREGDRAYRDLLLTQARYRCYITATSDSDINRALDYYRRHSGEREKLTRAYIYKGAVMEELGHSDSAMIYYKTAEATAAPTDYFNLGYSKLRIGDLYQSQYSKDTAAIARLKDAIKCFEYINDSNYIMVSYGILGTMSDVVPLDSSEYYLTRAIELAQLTVPSKQYTYKSKLAGLLYYNSNDYQRANCLAMEVFNEGSEYCNEYQFYYYAAMTFLKLGKIDSAKYILERFPTPIDAVDSMNLFNIKADIALAEDKLGDYGIYAVKSKDLESQILTKKKEKEIAVAEHVFDHQQTRNKEQMVQRRNSILKVGLTLVLIITVLLAIVIYLIKLRIRQKDKEQLQIISELNRAIKDLQEKIELEERKSENSSTIVKYRMDALNELFDNIKYKAKEIKDNKRNIVTLRSILNDLDKNYVEMKVNLSEDFWEKIRLSVDGEFNGIATYVEKNYPQLSDREFRIFCLLCTGITPQIIKRCMNITSVRTATNYRSGIMKKLGLNMKFDEFLQMFKNGEANGLIRRS